eukprot:Nk52_evm11s242 gene=Nk52_evmTU11s242
MQPRIFVCLSLIVAVLVCVLGCAQSARVSMAEHEEFMKWLKKHDKEYDDLDVHVKKLAQWVENYRMIVEHNARNDVSYEMEMNEHGDMSFEEFAKMFLMSETPKVRSEEEHHPDREIFAPAERNAEGQLLGAANGSPHPATAEHVDWRKKGIVSDVKNQKQCGSCWSFATAQAIEGAHALQTGQLITLSEQQMVDCGGPPKYKLHGCNGSENMVDGFRYVMDVGGLEREDDYPYKAVEETCKVDKKKFVASIRSYGTTKEGCEKELQEAVATKGPVAIVLHAERKLMFYKKGIFYDENCPNRVENGNHALLLVGYGVDRNNDWEYWTIKNSWGPTWGVNGYFHLKRNAGNQCGIANMAAYPVV